MRDALEETVGNDRLESVQLKLAGLGCEAEASCAGRRRIRPGMLARYSEFINSFAGMHVCSGALHRNIDRGDALPFLRYENVATAACE